MPETIVIVKFLTGLRITVTIDDHATVRELKEAIERRTSLPSDGMFLSLVLPHLAPGTLHRATRPLGDDNAVLSAVGVERDSVIGVIMRRGEPLGDPTLHKRTADVDTDARKRRTIERPPAAAAAPAPASSSSSSSAAAAAAPVAAHADAVDDDSVGSVLIVAPEVRDDAPGGQRLHSDRFLVPMRLLTAEQRTAVVHFSSAHGRDLTRYLSFIEHHERADPPRELWSTRAPWAIEQVAWRLGIIQENPDDHVEEARVRAIREDLMERCRFHGGEISGRVRLLVLGTDHHPGDIRDAFRRGERSLFYARPTDW